MINWFRGFIRYGILPTNPFLWISLAFGALSIASLIQYGFDFNIGSTFRTVLEGYDSFIGVFAEWLDPAIRTILAWLNERFGWQLELHAYWKHIFVLMGIYFLRDATNSFKTGYPISGVFRSIWAVLNVLIASVYAGTISIGSGDVWANFQIAAIPTLAVFTYGIGTGLWYATFERIPDAVAGDAVARTWKNQVYIKFLGDLQQLVAGVILIGAGLQVPQIRALPSPGLTLLGGLIIILAIYLLWASKGIADHSRHWVVTWSQSYWRQGSARIGATILGVMFWDVILYSINAVLVQFGY